MAVTFEGGELATEVQKSAGCSNETKAKLIREIMDHEGARGTCTQTFIKKVRKADSSGKLIAEKGRNGVVARPTGQRTTSR